MKSHTVEVKVQDKVVGSATFNEFDSLAEALEHLDEGKILGMVNRQLKQEETNKVRAKAQSDTPARKIGRIARQLKKGDIDKSAVAALVNEILASS